MQVMSSSQLGRHLSFLPQKSIQLAPRKKSVTADLVEAEAVREEKLPLVQSDVADHEVDLDREW